MKLRLIVLVLSLLAILSASSSGLIYYGSLKKNAVNAARKEAAARAESLRKSIGCFLSKNTLPVRTLARMPEIREALQTLDDSAMARADMILDLFRNTLEADVCYLIDSRGNTIASSNRNEKDSFVGLNFAFRPYFQNAMKGQTKTYPALGAVSGKRGAYDGCPVYPPEDFGENSRPIGVVVIKAAIGRMENELRVKEDETILVTEEHGMVFLSSRREWLYRTLTPLPPDTLTEIEASLQFGKGPWPEIGLTLTDGVHAADNKGNRYLIQRDSIDGHPGWWMTYLQDRESVLKKTAPPIRKTMVRIVLILCLLVGVSAFVLYRKAVREILRRKIVEKDLEESRERYRRISRDLEKQVGIRTEEITSILKYTPDVVYIKDTKGRYLMVNPRFEELFGVGGEQIRGKTAHECIEKELADQFRFSDEMVLEQEKACRIEHPVHQPDGIHIYLSVKFPIYDASGNIIGVGGIATDVTELKNAQKDLQRMSGVIMEGQEKERAAIARELHDELGQMLTALRMEAVWLRKRIGDRDEQMKDRAESMCGMIDKTIEDVRGISMRLRPGVLDTLGLVDALEWYTSDFEERTGITCVFENGKVGMVENTVATTVYRIAQESLTNVARHAKASRADVILKADTRILGLTVTDNGKGFDTAILKKSQGLGITGMRERAALVGGTLEVESMPGEGTRVVFSLETAAVGGGGS